MSKARLNLLMAALNFRAFLAQAVSGFVLWLVLTRGTGGGWRTRGDVASFIFARHVWLDIHHWAAIALLCFVAIHLALHYKWVVSMLKSLFR